ncbi:MAG TPA: DPP IV N-terminal domain-containing protein [Pirellulaceae bacterium]|nr:DPP IV N-terminal domain-containing protein [Pirellulaceae bacterium]
MSSWVAHVLIVLSIVCIVSPSLPAQTAGQESVRDQESSGALQTIAERSEFTATARHADVIEFCQQLAARSKAVELAELGKSFEGRSLPLLIIADPPLKTPAEAAKSKKLVVFAMGNIHAGEVCGKEALLMLARDLVSGGKQPLLKDLVVLFAPIYNADGNERFAPDHRPGQIGPEQMGQRSNAQGLDLNRDHIKLESPEARALVRLLNRWNPAIAIDCHTTNGSYHRFALTYDGSRHPATHSKLLEYVRDEFLPEVSRRLERETKYKTFFYGNFAKDHTIWESYPAEPRFSTHYLGLRNQLGILSEAYAYATYHDRVMATYGFVRHCLAMAADRRAQIEAIRTEARKSANSANTDEPLEMGIRFEPAPLAGRFSIPGFVEREENGKKQPTNEEKDYDVQYFGQSRPTLAVVRPFAYALPASYQAAVENLHRHGVAMRVLREDIEVDAEVYRVNSINRQGKEFQGHKLVQVEVTARLESRRLEAGSIIVNTSQPLSPLIVTLLEPASQDGLTTWNFFDAGLTADQDFPVTRIMVAAPLLTATYSAPKQSSASKKPITFESLYGRNRPNFSGQPASGVRWLDDGEHYAQRKEGRVYKVHAITGRSELLYDPATITNALKSELEIDARAAQRLTSRLQLNTSRSAGLVLHASDLYLVTLQDGSVQRLTTTPEAEELASFSPDGQQVAFIRGDDLFVVNLETKIQLRLTSDAGPTLRNGKADWVYFEEIYGRNWQAYKWSPDSKRLAFQQFEDAGVDQFEIANDLPKQQQVESTRYPQPGRPNPRVRLAVVAASGGPISWIDLDNYSPDNLLISHFGWTPNSQAVFYYVQDRAQRWLDFNQVELASGTQRTLFRDTTEAWVSSPGDPHFLNDGSFLITSERDGWQHLYHFSDGKLRQVTQGQWEMRSLHVVDEESQSVYFSATADSHLASNLYRIKMDGSQLTRLTMAAGDHRVAVSPSGKQFVDSCSSHRHPTKVTLFSSEAMRLRTIDTNPVPAIDDFDFAPLEMIQIKTRDGFLLEGSLIKPKDFDESKKYPVWLMTYGGPHAPTISDSWRGGRTYEQMLAQMGVIAFRVDPRSASGKGACSTWTAYRQLGVPELKDLEDAVQWLCQKPYVDSSRVGMAGHSYGGFLTAYALTHSKRFAAGIAGAPVTDWRSYDTIYTERYMDTPQENPDGYKATSVVDAAKNLHGRLLILHGGRDDNVHLANTLQFVQALQSANKQFELMIYPPNRHGLYGRHYSELTVGFIRRTLLNDS